MCSNKFQKVADALRERADTNQGAFVITSERLLGQLSRKLGTDVMNEETGKHFRLACRRAGLVSRGFQSPQDQVVIFFDPRKFDAHSATDHCESRGLPRDVVEVLSLEQAAS